MTRLGDGAWCWFADPRAVRHGTRTYVGWVARNGDIVLAAYDHTTDRHTRAVVAPRVQADDHANPALQILPDGRLRVYWSKHCGDELCYRTAGEPPRRLSTNTPGPYGYTYPNPVHLSAERATYLFWRGGDFNPAFAIQRDGEEVWTQAASLIRLPGQRPYLKVAGNGADRIAFAYTDAHPAEHDTVDIHYVEYRSGQGLYGAGGRRVGSLEQPIAPADGDLVYRGRSWVHDVALDPDGRPVVVFAAFPDLHRYHYARWTGQRWDVHKIVAAGGSIQEDRREPFYSGGITLVHGSADVVQLSREVDGVFEIETWRTPDGGASWTSRAVTARSGTKNVRPVSPRGLQTPFTGACSVLWMRGGYPGWTDYRTSIVTPMAPRTSRRPPRN